MYLIVIDTHEVTKTWMYNKNTNAIGQVAVSNLSLYAAIGCISKRGGAMGGALFNAVI